MHLPVRLDKCRGTPLELLLWPVCIYIYICICICMGGMDEMQM